MELFFQTLMNGTIIGGTYALTAIGLTLIFGYMHLVNFAHGELYMLGAYFTFTLVVMVGLPFWIGFPLALVGVFILAMLLDVVLLRPLRNQDVLIRMLTTIGLMLLFQNLALLIWGPVPKRVPSPIDMASFSLFGMRVAPLHLLVAGAALAIILLAHLFMQYTRTGMAMRATFQDQEVAAAMGVKVNRFYGFTFAFGAVLAAAGGGLLSMIFLVTPTMGVMTTAKAFAVVILGGLGSFLGAIFGGLIIGIAESMGATFLWADYKDGIAFVILLVILMIKPNGLFGKAKGVE
jgi:branched-chain amino acid transport system permease protein